MKKISSDSPITPRAARGLPWPAAAAVVLAGALAASGVEWTVSVRRAEVKDSKGPFVRPRTDLEQGKSFDGVLDGEWVRITEKGKEGFVLRSQVATEDEVLKDPFLSIRIGGTFYPEDVQAADPIVHDWLSNPVIRDTGRAPGAWALEDFRSAGGLGGGK
ncbi:MAG: hypothetical protein K8T20_06680 [Planctomycetes bacterium]|nr:hypothetical protein [Planctomycetota bacterium]